MQQEADASRRKVLPATGPDAGAARRGGGRGRREADGRPPRGGAARGEPARGTRQDPDTPLRSHHARAAILEIPQDSNYNAPRERLPLVEAYSPNMPVNGCASCDPATEASPGIFADSFRYTASMQPDAANAPLAICESPSVGRFPVLKIVVDDVPRSLHHPLNGVIADSGGGLPCVCSCLGGSFRRISAAA
jgi:hypothetical protein